VTSCGTPSGQLEVGQLVATIVFLLVLVVEEKLKKPYQVNNFLYQSSILKTIVGVK
jgi:hypothetical protein